MLYWIRVKKSGVHSEKEFMKIMNKKFGRECGIFLNSLKCESCKKSKKKLHMKMLDTLIEKRNK